MGNEQQQQQMITDGIDFVTIRLGDYVDCCTQDSITSFEEVTEIIAFHLSEGNFTWKDLPLSWSNCIPLARKCVYIKPLPLSTRDSHKDKEKFHWVHLPVVCQSDVEVVLTAISSAHINQWEEIPILLRSDDRVVFAAWKNILRWHEKYYANLTHHCPMLNRDFFRICIEQEKIDDWDDLPYEYRTDVDFARSLRNFPSKSIAYSVLDQFPDMCDERLTWVTALGSTASIFVGSLLELFAPAFIVSDRSLMLQACRFNAVFRSVDETLRQDRSFVCEVLQQYPQQLLYLDDETQFLFPDLIRSTLKTFCELNLPRQIIRKLTETLDRSFWDERSNIIAWFSSGLPHPLVLESSRNITLEFYHDDKELAIIIATYGHDDYRKDSFSRMISATLRSDKLFMKEVLNLDPRLIICAADHLKMDFDLVLFSISSSKHMYEYYTTNHADYLREFLGNVSQKLLTHDTYVNLILRGIEQPQCCLSLLGHGNETTTSFKKAIALYLDVPVGLDLRMLRQCEEYSYCRQRKNE